MSNKERKKEKKNCIKVFLYVCSYYMCIYVFLGAKTAPIVLMLASKSSKLDFLSILLLIRQKKWPETSNRRFKTCLSRRSSSFWINPDLSILQKETISSVSKWNYNASLLFSSLSFSCVRQGETWFLLTATDEEERAAVHSSNDSVSRREEKKWMMTDYEPLSNFHKEPWHTHEGS